MSIRVTGADVSELPRLREICDAAAARSKCNPRLLALLASLVHNINQQAIMAGHMDPPDELRLAYNAVSRGTAQIIVGIATECGIAGDDLIAAHRIIDCERIALSQGGSA